MTAMPHSASPPHQPRPPSAPSLPPPTLRLPTERRHHGAAVLLASLAHGAIIAVLLWRGAALLASDGNGPGPRGGGGGEGGRPAVRFLALPAFSAPQAFDVPAPPTITVSEIPMPDPAALKLPPVDVPRLPVAATAAPSVGTGPGSGGGGAQGTGTGMGSGSDVGSGRGGEAGYILGADLKGLIIPPDCAPRARYHLRFWVAADGSVTDVTIDPLPKDPSCRRGFVGRGEGDKFAAPRTRDR